MFDGAAGRWLIHPRQQVPWKTFASGKASLQVSGLTLVLEPLGSTNYDDEIERGLRDAIFAKKQVICGYIYFPTSTGCSTVLLYGLAGQPRTCALAPGGVHRGQTASTRRIDRRY